MVRFNFCNNIPEAEHCSSKIVDFTKKNVVEIVEMNSLAKKNFFWTARPQLFFRQNFFPRGGATFCYDRNEVAFFRDNNPFWHTV